MDTEKHNTTMRQLVSAIKAERGRGCFIFGGIKQQSLFTLDDAILPPVGEISAGGIMGLKTHTII